MDETPTRARDTAGHRPLPHSLPPGWTDAQDSLAAETGLSILLVEGHQPPALSVSNNNSICYAIQSSPAHAPLCEPYCGVAYERALKAGAVTHYRCHAGLECITMPVDLGTKETLCVIGGRAFLTSADYRALAERFRVGDLQDLLSSELFKNVIFASRQDLSDLARRVAETAREFKRNAIENEKRTGIVQKDDVRTAIKNATTPVPATATTLAAASISAPAPVPVEMVGPVVSASIFHSFRSDLTFEASCEVAMQTLAEQHQLTTLALLFRDRNNFTPCGERGRFKGMTIHVEIEPQSEQLLTAARNGTSLLMRATPDGFMPIATPDAKNSENVVELFPLVIGDEIKGAILAGDADLNDEQRREIFRYGRGIALPLEVLRLRHELEQRARFADYLQSFTEHINSSEPEEMYYSILRHSVELLHAERGSLLLFDEAANELAVKAAFGLRAEVTGTTRMRLEDGVSGAVLQTGKPVVVRDLQMAGYQLAPAERCYKTKSFISYPIIIGGRKVGVLNVTDKAGGGPYDDVDLSLLEIIVPQVALALDRAEWRDRAAQFQLMSITDPLTGLLNRRYLEERLTEEIKRSKRQQYPMSFMMIDIDDFKVYNDRNGHPAGDLALEMTAQCLKSALRSADVAARYGGEEFCILLPQTSLSEATSISERIRRRVERTRFPHGQTQPLGAVTVSIGVASFSPELDTAATVIEAADRALYLAKNLGKNQVQAHDEESESVGEREISETINRAEQASERTAKDVVVNGSNGTHNATKR